MSELATCSVLPDLLPSVLLRPIQETGEEACLLDLNLTKSKITLDDNTKSLDINKLIQSAEIKRKKKANKNQMSSSTSEFK